MPHLEPLDDPSASTPEEFRTERVPPETFFELLDDEYVQQILARIATTPKSGRELSRLCEASRATIYRRLNRLEDVGWVETSTRLDEDGHHRTLYVAALDEVRFELENGRFRTEATVDSTNTV